MTMRTSIALCAALGPLLLGGCGSGSDEAAAPLCGTGEERAAVVTSLAFTREEPKGVSPGFNLDGRVSDGNDTVTCGHEDRKDPDGVPGIDNQLAGLIPDLENLVGNAVDGLIQGAINNGELLLLVDLQGVDDMRADGCVGLRTELGKGVPAIGTDGVIEAYQTYDLSPANVESSVEGGRIEDGVMTGGPFDVAVPLKIFDVDFTLTLHDAQFRFTIAEDGTYTGMFGGGIVIEEVLAGAGQGAGTEDIVGPMGVVMRASADLGPDADGVCKQLSSTLAFTAVPAFVRR